MRYAWCLRKTLALGLLGGDEVQTLVKFVNLPSPHPCPSPLGRGGRRPGEGSAALGDPTLGGKRLLATLARALEFGRFSREFKRINGPCP